MNDLATRDEPLIDTHVHFWDHAIERLRWPWLEPGFAHRALADTHTLDAPRYTPPEFMAEAGDARPVALVHVGAADRIDDYFWETEWLLDVAAEHGLPTAIVGTVLIGEPDAVDLTERHAGHDRVRGIRDVYAARNLDPDAGAAALDAMVAAGLSFEARPHVEKLEVLGGIADRWPELTVVAGHACLPQQRTDQTHREWRAAMRRLAERPNVVCKISAVAGASEPDWTVDSIRPWILDCVELFGTERAMFGTNWPIDRLVATYPQLIDAYRQITAPLTPDERADLFHRTAARIYRLPPL